MTDEATAAVDAAVADAVDTVEGAADAATDAATNMANEAADAMPLDQLLDPANFDLERVTAAVEASNIDAALKTQLTRALDAAKDSPALLTLVLQRVNMALTQ